MKKTYFFDAILVTSTMPEIEVTTDSLRPDGGRLYSIRLFDDFEDLPIDRLFVEQFPEGPAMARFTASPCELIGALTTKGVCVGLTENEEQIAAGNFMLGPTILRQLTDPTFSVTQSVMVELKKGRKTVCVVELIVKISSSDPDLNQMLVPYGTYDVCRPAEREISKRDIIFTLGRSGKCGTNTCITDERLMSHAGAPNPCPHAPTEDAEAKGGAAAGCGCYRPGMEAPNAKEEAKKKEKAALKKLIEELGLDQVKVPKPPRAFKKSRRWHHSTTTSTPETTSSCHTYDFLPESPPKKRKALSLTASMEQQARHRILGPCPVVAEPELKNEPYKPPQLCQLCKSDISWLPKISACPYCGYKTFEDIPPSEGNYDITATAQQLLQDCLRKEACEKGSSSNGADLNDAMGDGPEDPHLPKRCRCLSGQPCTRCRIRSLCENFVKENDAKQKTLPQAQVQEQRVSKDQSKPVQGKDPPKSSTPQNHSQLVSIFTEMRNMYAREKGADEADAEAEKKRKECDTICRNTKTAKDRRKDRKALEKALKEIDKAYPKPHKKRVKKRVQRPKSKCYTFLKLNRQRKDRHTACISDGACSGYCKVPCHMGWMWTKSEMARYKSWRPGAISKPIRQMMAYFLRDFPADTICLSRYHYLRRKGRKEKPVEEPLVQHPTLQISRKGDEYVITLRPLKDPKSLAVSANPYADMKPVVFRITKDPEAVALRELREYLGDKGFAPCTCGRILANCFCRSHTDKKRIQYEVDQLSRRRGWSFNSDSFKYSAENDDDDDSDREYEFGVTPPAGVIKPERQPRPDRTNAETQYMETDWAAPSMFPHAASMLAQYGACVMGERKKEFSWLFGKGNIHAEPKKPVMKNPPKKKKNKKSVPFRAAGGYDDPRRFDPPPLNRPLKNKAPGRWRKN